MASGLIEIICQHNGNAVDPRSTKPINAITFNQPVRLRCKLKRDLCYITVQVEGAILWLSSINTFLKTADNLKLPRTFWVQTQVWPLIIINYFAGLLRGAGNGSSKL